MSKCIKIKRGLNIKLVGEANKIFSDLPLPETFAIKPPNFIGITPKLLVKQGDEVKPGHLCLMIKIMKQLLLFTRQRRSY